MKMIKRIYKRFKNLFTKRRNKFDELVISDFLPLKIEQNKIYFSKKYMLVKFMCPNNCGNETVLSIGKTVNIKEMIWTISIKDNKATIKNSIGSADTCGAHYYIIKNKVHWLPNM